MNNFESAAESTAEMPPPTRPDEAPKPRNLVLEALSEADRQEVLSCAQQVTVRAGEVLAEPGKPLTYAYFPLSGLMSAMVPLANGSLVEIAMIGSEGFAGIETLFDSKISATRIVQRMEGESLRVSVLDIERLFRENSAMRAIFGRFVLSLLQQCSQNAACNLHHRLEERMCRWLATTADRTGATVFRITQEFLSDMLGVSRQSINATAGLLHQQGLITYSRGRLEIVDRAALEAASCACHAQVKQAYQQLMHPT